MEKYLKLIENSKFYLDSNFKSVTNLSNLSAYLFENIDDINWAGFYLFDGSELYLGPFQGKPACTSIKIGNGVCGVSAKNRETLVVKDVNKFNGHITCDSVSKSEIVVPIITKNGDLYGVLDIDSPRLNRFDLEIKKALEIIVDFLVDIL